MVIKIPINPGSGAIPGSPAGLPITATPVRKFY